MNAMTLPICLFSSKKPMIKPIVKPTNMAKPINGIAIIIQIAPSAPAAIRITEKMTNPKTIFKIVFRIFVNPILKCFTYPMINPIETGMVKNRVTPYSPSATRKNHIPAIKTTVRNRPK